MQAKSGDIIEHRLYGIIYLVLNVCSDQFLNCDLFDLTNGQILRSIINDWRGFTIISGGSINE